jgi:hypothetical protein
VVLADLLGFSLTTVGATSLYGLAVVPHGWLNAWHSKSEEDFGGTPLDVRSTTLSMAPSVDYFVSDRVSLGGCLALGYAKRGFDTSPAGDSNPDSTYYDIAVEPRAGITWPLSDDLTLWTQVGLGVNRGRAQYADHQENTSSWHGTAEVQLVAKASRSVLFAVGPAMLLTSFKSENDGTGATIRQGWLAGGYMKGTVGLVL